MLFKDSTTELVSISKDKRTYQGFLTDDYVKDVQALKSCDNASSTKPPKSVSTKPTISVSTKTTPYAVIVLLVAMVAVMSL